VRHKDSGLASVVVAAPKNRVRLGAVGGFIAAVVEEGGGGVEVASPQPRVVGRAIEGRHTRSGGQRGDTCEEEAEEGAHY
jgi:hypothetical protein